MPKKGSTSQGRREETKDCETGPAAQDEARCHCAENTNTDIPCPLARMALPAMEELRTRRTVKKKVQLKKAHRDCAENTDDPCALARRTLPAKEGGRKRRTFKQWLQLKYMQYNVTRYLGLAHAFSVHICPTSVDHAQGEPVCTTQTLTDLQGNGTSALILHMHALRILVLYPSITCSTDCTVKMYSTGSRVLAGPWDQVPGRCTCILCACQSITSRNVIPNGLDSYIITSACCTVRQAPEPSQGSPCALLCSFWSNASSTICALYLFCASS